MFSRIRSAGFRAAQARGTLCAVAVASSVSSSAKERLAVVGCSSSSSSNVSAWALSSAWPSVDVPHALAFHSAAVDSVPSMGRVALQLQEQAQAHEDGVDSGLALGDLDLDEQYERAMDTEVVDNDDADMDDAPVHRRGRKRGGNTRMSAVERCNRRMGQHLRANRFLEAADVLEEMLLDGIEPDIRSYHQYIVATSRVENLQAVFQALDTMVERGVQPDQGVYNTVLNALARAKLPELAERISEQMKKEGVEGDERTMSAMLSCYARCNQLDKAEALLDDALSNDAMQPTEFMFSALLNGATEIRNVDFARKVYALAQESSIDLTVVTFNAMLNALMQCGQLQEGLELYEQAQGTGMRFNNLTHSILVKGYLQAKDVGGAVQQFHQMREQGFSATVTTYNAVVQRLLESKDPETLMNFLDETDALAIVPRANLMNKIIVELAPLATEQTDGLVKRMWDELDQRGLKASARAKEAFLALARSKLAANDTQHDWQAIVDDLA